jgi:uncharacterized protein YdhG (YjbR/CyaY superfamily)
LAQSAETGFTDLEGVWYSQDKSGHAVARREKEAVMEEKTFTNIDEYIALFPADIQDRLRVIRAAIREAAPNATEKISWQMPTFYQHGNVVHFAAFKDHISLFPGASGVEVFTDRLTAYKTSKGTIQFPYSQPIPLELVKEIVRFRVEENKQAAQTRKKKTK